MAGSENNGKVRMNGNGKSLAAWVGVALVIGGLIASTAIAIATRADQHELDAACNRITVVETNAIHATKTLERIEAKLEQIERELKRGQ